jgi:hypothetical protein
VEPPETRYARSGDAYIAYQVVGEGPFDLLQLPGGFQNVELWWGTAELKGIPGEWRLFAVE